MPVGAGENLVQGRGQYATLAQQNPLRSPKNHGEIAPRDRSSFCEILCAVPRCPLAARLVFRPLLALRVRRPDSKYIYIDAVRSQSVTRETLLRYTVKSAPVNNLISGNLWKTHGSIRCNPSRPQMLPLVVAGSVHIPMETCNLSLANRIGPA